MPVRLPALAALALTALLAPALAAAQAMAGEEVRVGAAEGDVYAAGGRVESAEPVAGDLVVAGGEVSVRGPVGGDVLAGGGRVEIAGDVGDDVRAVGGEVRLAGTVGDAAVLAGGSVEIGSTARVGHALLAGGEVRVLGVVERGLRAAGGRVELGGEVTGDVEVTAQELRVLPGARIDGTLRYASGRPADVSPRAEVTGGVVRTAIPDDRGPGVLGAIALGGLWIVGLSLLGLVLLALLPGASAETLRVARAEPGKAVAAGLVAALVTPLVAVPVALTGAGTPLALVALAAWLVLLLVGYVAGALVVGEVALLRLGRTPTRGARFLGLLGALVLLRLLRLVPFLGPLFPVAAACLGMGAIVVAVAARRAQGRAAPPLPAPS